jgi:pimeloyl-ACP methyl ester carboxylesterase
MNDRSKFLWVSASPSLKQFHRRLLHNLSATVEIEFWEYYQTLDEGSSIDSAIELLHEYLITSDCQFNLIGHGISGAIALGYARKYPDRVSSLVLLSVAVQPAISWHSYYYNQLRFLPCNRDYILRSIASNLFPDTCLSHISSLADRLERDLLEAPSNHSLFNLSILPEGKVEMPLMICGSQDDCVISQPAFSAWNHYLKFTDILHLSPAGGHFFHYFYPELIGRQIQEFWHRSTPISITDRLMSVEIN